MTTQTATQPPEKKPELQSVMAWLDVPGAAVPAPADPQLEGQAEEIVGHLLTVDPKNIDAQARSRNAIQSMGIELQREAARRSEMLKQPVKKLYENATEGGQVGNALVDLKVKIEELDPGKFDLEPGWMTRMVGMLPFVGTPIKRYFSRYESAKTIIDAIVRALRLGREQLLRDNHALTDDQKAMALVNEKLEKAIKLGQLIDAKLSAQIGQLAPGDARRAFAENEWLFPLRQRIMDLQQQLAVNQQGILAIDIIIRNNVELARGVDRAVNVTVSALQVAVTLAMALANQRITLEKVQAVNETTEKLIADTARNLRTQGAEIHKMAAGTTLDMETLKQSFADIRAALEDIARFRQEALPQMASTILELDKLSEEAGRAIKNVEAARGIGATLEQAMGQKS
jgi:uncharacterized protein YaaN involved in tellurite resistance